jgi:hypothetical protein
MSKVSDRLFSVKTRKKNLIPKTTENAVLAIIAAIHGTKKIRVN